MFLHIDLFSAVGKERPTASLRVSVVSHEIIPLRSHRSAHGPRQPCLSPTAIACVFLLEFLEAGAVPLEQVLITCLAKAGRKELTEGPDSWSL